MQINNILQFAQSCTCSKSDIHIILGCGSFLWYMEHLDFGLGYTKFVHLGIERQLVDMEYKKTLEYRLVL